MNCACQADDEQSYFAYITKDNDSHYCHIFQALSPVSLTWKNQWILHRKFQEHATEIILTLGQAFELAYQMALRDHVTSKGKPAHSKAAMSPSSSSHGRDFKVRLTYNLTNA